MLTIIIPTYNRKNEISKILPTIINSTEFNSKKIKLIVSDNCSTDGSIEYLQGMSDLHGFELNINRNNLGFAGNLHVLVSLVDTEYFWLMGSDEIISDDAIPRVVNSVENLDSDIFIGDCAYQGGSRRKFYKKVNKFPFVIHDRKTYAKFLNSCNELSAGFAFISTLIIRKAIWNNVILTRYESEHPYLHMLVINKAISNQSIKICNIDSVLVFTGYAENEFNKNKINHLKLDMETTSYIVSNYFDNDSSIKRSFKRFFLNYRIFLLLKNKTNCLQWNELNYLFDFFGISKFIYKKRKIDLYLELLLRKIYSIRKIL